MKTHSLLLASTALLVLTAASPQARAAAPEGALMLAQAGAPPPAQGEKKPEEPPKAAPPKAAPPKAAPPPPPKQPAPPPPVQRQAPPPPPPVQRQAPPPPPPKQPAPPPAVAPKQPAPPPVQAPPPRTQAPPPPAAQPPARTQAPPPAGAPMRQERRDERREQRQEQRQAPPPATQPPAPSRPATQAPAQPPAALTPAKPPATTTQQKPAATTTPPPAATTQPPPASPPAAAPQATTPPQGTFRGPAPSAQPPQQRGAGAPPPPPSATPPAAQRIQPPATMAPPTQPRDARDFIRRDNQAPTRTIDQVRRERQQTQQGNRTVITEGDRTIVRQGNRTFIRHSEANRFAIGATNVRTDRRGNQTSTVIARPNGVSIINITDADGRLVRRVRRDARGRQVIIIDNSFAGARRGSFFVDLPPPRIRIPRERYIVDAWDAEPDDIYGVFLAPPVERLERRYTLDEVRYSEPLRARMPRVDLDINFETGSWQLTPEQIDKLGVIAEGLNRAIERNPREVFLIEGHTDAVGSDEDNLSLSDRRAEAVAVALTEQFQVPAENLVTQGYGEQNLKEPTDGPSRINRRVAVRRITPLIDQQAGGPPPR